jgi:hypothetical protein
MNPAPLTPRATLAAYLSGQRQVRPDDLAAAVAQADQDVAYRQRLLRLLAGSPDGSSECHAVRARLAELAECSAAELGRRFPVFAAHLEFCGSCRDEYWQIKPQWTRVAGAVVQQGAAKVCQRLATDLRLVVSGARALLDASLGPLSLPVESVATTADRLPSAGAGPSGSAARLEWRFEDEQSGATLRLAVSPQTTGTEGALIECSLDWPSGTDPGARIEISEIARHRVLVSGPLARFTENPIALGPGSYLIAIESAPPALFRWEIPLDLTARVER